MISCRAICLLVLLEVCSENWVAVLRCAWSWVFDRSVGTLLRSACAFGVSEAGPVLYLKDSCHHYHKLSATNFNFAFILLSIDPKYLSYFIFYFILLFTDSRLPSSSLHAFRSWWWALRKFRTVLRVDLCQAVRHVLWKFKHRRTGHISILYVTMPHAIVRHWWPFLCLYFQIMQVSHGTLGGCAEGERDRGREREIEIL